MKTNRILAVVLFALTASLAWAEDDAAARPLRSRSFKLLHRSPERAAAILKPLISAGGSISIQPATNTIVVTDHAENLRGIAQALEQFDAPARPFRVELKIVAASRAAAPAAVPDDLKEISTRLGSILRFNAFEKLAEFSAEGKEGDSLANLQVGEAYRADLVFGEHDPVGNVIKLQDLQISRAQPGAAPTVFEPLLKRTSLNLKIGQTVILGAQRPESDRALMFVLIARRVE